MVNKINDLRNIWIPRMFPRSEATDTIRTEVVTTLVRRNRGLENASLGDPLITKILDPYPEQADRFFDLASQFVFGMNDLALRIMPKLVEFPTDDLDGAIIVEIVQESIKFILRPYWLKPPLPDKGPGIFRASDAKRRVRPSHRFDLLLSHLR